MSKKESRLVKSSINKREMRDMVGDYLHRNQGRQLALKNVFSEMGLTKHPLRMLCVDILNEMLEAGDLVKNHDGYFIYRGTAHVVEGTFNRTSGGRNYVDTDDGSIQIDSARWAKYAALKGEDYLATQFEERLAKHVFELSATIKFPKNVLKVGGIWTYRTDMSKFNQDDLLNGFDFSDETYGILGYYFHGGDYLDARYPISLTTTLDRVRNTVSVTPRFRIYNRDDMSEFEWNLLDNAMIQLNPGFLDLMLHGNIRQNFMSRKEDGKDVHEMEMDVDLSAGLKFQFTERLGTEFTFGTFLNYRPDNESEDYRDIYGSVSVNYDF